MSLKKNFFFTSRYHKPPQKKNLTLVTPMQIAHGFRLNLVQTNLNSTAYYNKTYNKTFNHIN